MINIITSVHKIPSFIELRHLELLRALDLDGKRVLELSSGLIDEGSEEGLIDEGSEEYSKYDAAMIYLAYYFIPENLISFLASFKSKVQRLVLVEDLAMNRLTEKIFQVREIIFPNYATNIQRLTSQLENIGFKKVERKIWKSQIPLSEDEVAWEIGVLNRIALERKIDLSSELQELITIYHTSSPVYKYFIIHNYFI
ncbi:MAG: hypothetical protein QXJ68_03970 [Methanocellales archaeon]